jgi:hypothetical protein
MTYGFKLSRRIARFRGPLTVALVLSFVGCNSTDSLSPESGTAPAVVDQTMGVGTDVVPEAGTELAAATGPEFASVSYSGGIPFGVSNLPNSVYGSAYNGSVRIIGPYNLLSDLAAIRSRGGRVIVNFAGGQSTYETADGHFSLTKWKARVARFHNINFSSYINDGTIIGHYLIDEPQDRTNWNGTQVSPATLEQMAQYSKSFWPGMKTIVRVVPTYLASNHRYLDAAWAQYTVRPQSAASYLSENVASAKQKGLGLIVGLNILKGGTNGSKMTPTQIATLGSTMLSSTYPCTFVSWTYNSTYLSTSGVKDAMSKLRSLARNRTAKSCSA